MSLYVFERYMKECFDKKVEPTFKGLNEYVKKMNLKSL